MAKKCVFCGKEVKSKSKEHVIPQWLIKHTNRTDKLIYINPNITAFKYMSFTFPACNEKYSKLESATKPVLLNLMDGRAVTPEQIDILLDWFNKVRIGLWLGQLQIKNPQNGEFLFVGISGFCFLFCTIFCMLFNSTRNRFDLQ